MSRGTLKAPKDGQGKKTGIYVTLVTVLFAIAGATFMIIGYKDEVLNWMVTTGVVFLVVGLIPLGAFAFMKINKKINS